MTPSQLGFFMPAEWHPHAGCWMAWPCHSDTWALVDLERARRAYAKIAQAIAQFEAVTMITPPDEVVTAQDYCGPNIRILPLPINDSWTRDTGATFLLNQQGELAGIDWIHNAWGGNYSDVALDNKIAAVMIQDTHAQYFSAPIVMEGGSFHVDGEGTVLTTRECLLNPNRNPHLTQAEIETYLHNYLGTKKVIWLNKGLFEDETDGHIDELACFIAPGKVLALITHDKNDVNYAALHENLGILKNTTDARGRALEIFTVEQPSAVYMQDRRLTLSYINFYLANQGIIMPAFGQAEYDEKAYKLFTQLFPQHKIIQIESLDIFAGGGGIHCITQQQPLHARK